MTTTPLDARSRVLDTATTALDARARADVELLMAAAEWAELHPAPAGSVDGYAGWGEDHLFDEGLTPLAGPGAPRVAEFAPCELAAVLGWTTLAAKQLMADAVELKHRLPWLWDLVGDLTVPVALARHVAQHTTDLCPDAAREADKLICTEPMRVSRVQVERLVDQVRLYFDPDRAVAEEQAALAARRVELRPGRTPATTEIQMSLDTLHAQAFDKTVADVAEALRRLGDCDDLDVRRARAVGVLAPPERPGPVDRRRGAQPPTRVRGAVPAPERRRRRRRLRHRYRGMAGDRGAARGGDLRADPSVARRRHRYPQARAAPGPRRRGGRPRPAGVDGHPGPAP